jgi:uncharacterized membrane protein YvbJ
MATSNSIPWSQRKLASKHRETRENAQNKSKDNSNSRWHIYIAIAIIVLIMVILFFVFSSPPSKPAAKVLSHMNDRKLILPAET